MNMLTQDPLLSPAALALQSPALGTGETFAGGLPRLIAPGNDDNIQSQYPSSPSFASPSTFLDDLNPMQSPMSMLLGPLGGILQYLSSLISQLTGGSGINQPAQNEQYFGTASGGSNGDPHLSFNGSTWNNMQSQGDLLNSNSFWGGYRVSTQTTPPNAQGVTYNQSATIHTNFGGTTVTLDNAGNATIEQNGNSFAFAPGSTYDLGHGETATRNDDGSVSVTQLNGQGGQITTTMRHNGQGVDVNCSANNVDLGGALTSGAPPIGNPLPIRRY